MTAIHAITPAERAKVNAFIREQWFSTQMAVRGKLVDMTELDGFVLLDGEGNSGDVADNEGIADNEIIGLVTYRFDGRDCEIMSLNSLREGRGIGTALIDEVIRTARAQECDRVKLITTNDNINALRFYQKRGFDMARLYRNALAVSRRLKPSIPLTGEFGIPLRHEIEFEMPLKKEE